VDAVVAGDADGAAVGFELVQVRQRLAEREAELVAVARPTEQRGDDLGGAARLDDRVQGLGQAGVTTPAAP
jgi:hypothetical protein